MSPLCYKTYVPLIYLKSARIIWQLSRYPWAIFIFLEDGICCDNVTHCMSFGRPLFVTFCFIVTDQLSTMFLLSEPMPHFDTNVFQWETLAPLYMSSTCMTRNPCILPCRASGKYTMPRKRQFHVYQGIYIIYIYIQELLEISIHQQMLM